MTKINPHIILFQLLRLYMLYWNRPKIAQDWQTRPYHQQGDTDVGFNLYSILAFHSLYIVYLLASQMVHFVLSDAVYPYRVGGMEVFNYYLIRERSKNEKIYYSSSHCLPFNSCHHYHLFPLRPTKIFNPFQVFLFHHIKHLH